MNNTFYSKNDYRYYLAHYGVKGMKWKHRKVSVPGIYQEPNGNYVRDANGNLIQISQRRPAAKAIRNSVLEVAGDDGSWKDIVKKKPRSRKKKVSGTSKGVKRRRKISAGKKYASRYATK